LSGEVKVLYLGDLLLMLFGGVIAELWDNIILVVDVVGELNVAAGVNESIIDAGVNIEVPVWWSKVGWDDLVIWHEGWGVSFVVSFLFGGGHRAHLLVIVLCPCVLLLCNGEVVGFGVDTIELDGQTVVELILVDSLHVSNWSVNGFALISSLSCLKLTSVPFRLESLLVGVEVPGVVLITGLESKTIVKFILVDSLHVRNWSLNGFAFISSLSLFSVPFFLESLLVGVEVL
jgi:hypothetical protein